jgi:histidinol-phosphate/aromatic aminotransferase/cobyric acid decarboxylase-like protein
MNYEDDHLLCDRGLIIQAIAPMTKVIVIANPNSKTGTFLPPEAFARIV